jgi:hypothetical protein
MRMFGLGRKEGGDELDGCGKEEVRFSEVGEGVKGGIEVGWGRSRGGLSMRK